MTLLLSAAKVPAPLKSLSNVWRRALTFRAPFFSKIFYKAAKASFELDLGSAKAGAERNAASTSGNREGSIGSLPDFTASTVVLMAAACDTVMGLTLVATL